MVNCMCATELHPPPTRTAGFAYFYSIPVFTVEWLGWLGWIYCVAGLWSTIDRPPRVMSTMMPEKDFPSVDVYIVAYNETVCAAN